MSEEIVKWYRVHQRKLPFRESKDPYCIWVSEIMAQQTRIDTMIPYYLRWIEKYPTLGSLAEAKIEDVLFLWQGLGYYNRARKLVAGAKQIMEQYNGVMPDTAEELLKIEGIGPYTAGAIASIAFHQPSPAVDGNVYRVITRIHKIDVDITTKPCQKIVQEITAEWIQEVDPSDFTQGLMEIGALVCTPTSPTCSLCPLSEECQSYQDNTMMNYPVKKKAKKQVELTKYTYLITCGDDILISEDEQDGLMKGYLRLPQFDAEITVNPEMIVQCEALGIFKHVFSHRIWHMHTMKMTIKDKIELPMCHWVKKEKLPQLAFVAAHQKLLDTYLA